MSVFKKLKDVIAILEAEKRMLDYEEFGYCGAFFECTLDLNKIPMYENLQSILWWTEMCLLENSFCVFEQLEAEKRGLA